MTRSNKQDLLRWSAWFVLAALFAVACVFLSRWQFDRRAQVVAQIQIVRTNYDAQPVEVESLVSRTSDSTQLKYRPVTLSGHYLPEKYLLVRNRANSGTPGFELLVPFVSKQTWIVDLGWIPTGTKQDFPDEIPVPSSEPTSITARLYPSEPGSNRTAPAHEVQEINIPEVQRLAQIESNGDWYLQLVHTEGTSKLPAPIEKPSTDEGSHLSYAFQWIAFATLAIWFFFYALRKELQIAAGKRSIKVNKPSRANLDNQAEDSAQL